MLFLSLVEAKASSDRGPEIPESLHRIFADPAVRDFFLDLYRPPRVKKRGGPGTEQENRHLASAFWDTLNLQSLELHRLGTTSFILRCRSELMPGEDIALKCLIFPYTRIEIIARATNDYAIKYPPGEVPCTAKVYCSTPRWIMMKFIEGLTLREVLNSRQGAHGIDEKSPNAYELIKSVVLPLISALSSLEQSGFTHEDLDAVEYHANSACQLTITTSFLIDLGRNYLYTKRIGVGETRKSYFIAPEIRDEGFSSDTSDLYSVGLIMTEICDPVSVQAGKDGAVPDGVYMHRPALARLIEDLIDINPSQRMLLVSKHYGDRYQAVASS